MSIKQPEAPRLAEYIYDLMDESMVNYDIDDLEKAAAELPTQHARITELESQLAQRFDAADMATAAQQGAAYAEMPDLSDANGEIWSAIIYWKHAKRGEDALRKASELERVLSDQMRAFADATHTLRASHEQASSQAGEYPALVCDYCGALTPDPWHSSGMLHGKMSKHIHSCDACAARGVAKAQAAKQQEQLI